MEDLKSNSSVAVGKGDSSPVRPSCSPRPNGSLLPKHDRRVPSPTIAAYPGSADQFEALTGIHIHSPELVPARHSAIRLRQVPRAGIEGNLALDPKGDLPRNAARASAAGTGGYLSRHPGALREHSGRTSATLVGLGHAPPSQLPRSYRGTGAKPIPRADAPAVPERADRLHRSPFPQTSPTKAARSSTQFAASAATIQTAPLELRDSELGAAALAAHAEYGSRAPLTSGNWGPHARGRQSDPWPGEVANLLPGLDLGSTSETL